MVAKSSERDQANLVTFRPVLFVLIGSVGIQSSAVISATLFEQLGTVAVSTLRLALAAVMLGVIFRPAVFGRSARRLTRERWVNAVIYGVAMAAMNQFLFAAIHRVPLGVAVPLDFLGPCLVSFIGLKRGRGRVWALVAFVGVALIAGPSSGLDPIGVGCGLAAGAFFAMYTVFAERVGKDDGGLGDLAVSVSVAALLTLPLAAPRLVDVTADAWVVLAVAAVVGVVIPYIADTLAARFSSAQVVGTLFALDPVVGSLLGWGFRDDALSVRMVAGIVLVTVAGAVITWRSAQH